MKKSFAAVTALVLVSAMALSGCGSSSSASESVTLTYGTGGTTGTYYPYGGTMATVLNGKMDLVDLTVTSTGASKANILDVEDGISQLAIVQNDVMYYAYNGTDLFAEDGQFTSFTAIASLYEETCQIIAAPGIESIEDLKGKTVNVGDAGSGVEFNATQILAAYGIDINSDINKVNGSFSDAADGIKDGKIDAAFVTAGAPTTAIVDLAISKDIVLLEVDDAHAEALMAEYPFYVQTVIPGGTYSGVDADAQTVSVNATLIASNDVSTEAIYELTKAMFENQADLAASNDKFSVLSVESAVQGIPTPFHPGAEQYYKEVGAID